MRLPAQFRKAAVSFSAARHLRTSASLLAASSQRHTVSYDEPEKFDDDDIVTAFMDADDDGETDTTSAGHIAMRNQRRVLNYLRLIENEVPKLVELRRPFTPPTKATPIVVREIDYQGEEHPVTAKRTIVVPVAQLPLRSADAIHKFKVLAGVRWTPEPPKDAGIGLNETDREHGYVKIACEDFPQPSQNLKWSSDVIDRLIYEANDPKDTFKEVPHDTRHLVAKARRAKNGEHLKGRIFHRPTLKDFPKDWLPTPDADLEGELMVQAPEARGQMPILQ